MGHVDAGGCQGIAMRAWVLGIRASVHDAQGHCDQLTDWPGPILGCGAPILAVPVTGGAVGA